MKKSFYCLMLLFLLWGLGGCSNDDENAPNPVSQLPPQTQTGENTFGCLINGEPLSITNSYHMTAIYQQGQLQFGGGGISMIINEPFSTNNQIDLTGKVRYIVDPNPQSGCHYEFEDAYKGFVKFSKIDQNNYIISGIFEFSTVNEQCDTVKITNGRFDMQYIP